MKGKWETTGLELAMKLTIILGILVDLATKFPFEKVYPVIVC